MFRSSEPQFREAGQRLKERGDSAVHAGEGHAMGHRGQENTMVPDGCSLVHSGRPTHVLSVCLHCQEGSARVSQA